MLAPWPQAAAVPAGACSSLAIKLAPTAGASTRQVKLQPLYRAGIAQSYVVTERTKGERRHSDESRKPYERAVTTHLTLRCIETQDGFATIIVNVDSLTYAFKEGDLSKAFALAERARARTLAEYRQLSSGRALAVTGAAITVTWRATVTWRSRWQSQSLGGLVPS